MTRTVAVPSVSIVNGQLTINSKDIAAFFERKHDKIVQNIEGSELPYCWRLDNFFQQYENIGDNQNPSMSKYFAITQAGFTVLSPMFGHNTINHKLAILDAFAANSNAVTATQPNNELAIFKFEDKLNVRVEMKNDTPWFVAKDIADILGYVQTNNMIKVLDSDEFMSSKLEGMNMKSILINESGLYNAIMSSTKPNAKTFRKWVTSEVLPAIRKTGNYSVTTSVPIVKTIIHKEAVMLPIKRASKPLTGSLDIPVSQILSLPVSDLTGLLKILNTAGYDVNKYREAIDLIVYRYKQKDEMVQSLKLAFSMVRDSAMATADKMKNYCLALSSANLKEIQKHIN